MICSVHALFAGRCIFYATATPGSGNKQIFNKIQRFPRPFRFDLLKALFQGKQVNPIVFHELNGHTQKTIKKFFALNSMNLLGYLLDNSYFCCR